MHELSIVEALITQVAEEVDRSEETGRVARVELRIGRLSGVHCDSIRFAFELLANDTIVDGATLTIIEPKAACRCHDCDVVTEIDALATQCLACGSGNITIEGGRDLLLQSIDLEDDENEGNVGTQLPDTSEAG